MTADYSPHFGLGDGIWMNTAHQGALPLRAAAAAREAIDWKLRPEELTTARFAAVPARLRLALANLMGAAKGEITLANSASYGLHLIANALRWRDGDEVVVMATDFPSDILPWMTLETRYGVKVRELSPKRPVISPDELRAAITPRTRVFCTTWVHSFSGHAADIDRLGDVCRANDVLFVVNGSQAIGARAVDVTRHPVDAITSVGFKWLCGPYGTGFCWMSDALLDRMQRTKAYWLSMLSADDLADNPGELRVGPIHSAADLDVFGTANFFNFTAFAEAVELLIDVGLENVEAHDQQLVQHIVDACEASSFRLISPAEHSGRRSTLVLIDHDTPERTQSLMSSLEMAGIRATLRANAVRFSPHLYNSAEQVRTVCGIISDAS